VCRPASSAVKWQRHVLVAIAAKRCPTATAALCPMKWDTLPSLLQTALNSCKTGHWDVMYLIVFRVNNDKSITPADDGF
jgi:hypothetical protein